jgi:2-methylcitrate dehydratase PrpD
MSIEETSGLVSFDFVMPHMIVEPHFRIKVSGLGPTALMPSETEYLASFLSSLTYDSLPPQVVQHAKASILNAIGCALGGASATPAVKARKAVLPLTAAQTSTILGRPERTDIQTAALVNGIALTNADYDDTHLKTVIHPSGAVLCAILAWGEQHQLSGKEILLAFVIGVEAQLRIGNAISPGHYTNGWFF